MRLRVYGWGGRILLAECVCYQGLQIICGVYYDMEYNETLLVGVYFISLSLISFKYGVIKSDKSILRFIMLSIVFEYANFFQTYTHY